nr:amino acid adenylation domain-containing protein [Micromonosporaceae bacterium]
MEDELTPTGRGGSGLSLGQERMWLLEHLNPGTAAQHLVSAFEVTGPLDTAALDRALRAVVDRHEPLRTSFHDAEGVPFAVVHEQGQVGLDLARARSVADGVAWAGRYASHPFDLTRPGLLRLAAVRVTGDTHLLVLAVHHIATDGWGRSVLYTELGAAYDAFRRGAGWAPQPLAMAYRDHVAAERRALAGGGWRASVDHWREVLADAPPELGILTDRPRQAENTQLGHSAQGRYEGAALAALKAYARTAQASTTMVLASAWAATLYRHGAGSDLVLGVPVSGRDHSRSAGLVGLFMNVLPLRVQVHGELPFADLLRQVRAAFLTALGHRQVPFELLVMELQPERSPGRTPFYQVLFNHGPAGRLELAGVGCRPLPFDTPYVQTDITLTLVDLPDGATVRMDMQCSADLFAEPVAGHLLRRFTRLLDDAVAGPDRPVDRLELLHPEELRRITAFAAPDPTPLPAAASVVELFEASVARHPRAIAVRAGAQALTYAELDAAADHLAHLFRAHGAGPGTVVALHLDRSWQMLAAMLAAWKAQAAYVPVDPAYPQQRIGYMLQDCDACLLVTAQPGDADRLPLLDVPVLTTAESLAGPPAVGRGAPPRRAGRPDDPAYLIYTSGSTGRPKGVEVPHRAVMNFLDSMAREPGCGPADVVLALTSPSFDIAVLELFLPLLTGGRVVIASPADAVDPGRLAALVRSEGVTVAQATPVTWQHLLAAAGDLRLRLALCGGEQVPRALADQLCTVAGEAWNMYGPTETTVWSLIWRVAPGEAGAVPIGRPIANTTAWVMDAGLTVAPLGVAGELCIGGAGLANGYHGLPAMTRARFITAGNGERLYRTGDLVRLTDDGVFEFLGRGDNQVKLRGHRIELDEISAVLRRHPAVADAVAVLRADDVGSPHLVAYVVPQAAGRR